MTNETHNTKPRRRWYQFSLRTLLIVVTLSAVPLGWFAWKVEQGRRQRAAVAWVREMGGGVGFWEDIDEHWWKERTDKWFGPSVRWAHLSNTQVSDLSPLAELKNLKELYLVNTQVSDLTPLAELRKLNILVLNNTPVSDAQVQKLRQALPNCDIMHPSLVEE